VRALQPLLEHVPTRLSPTATRASPCHHRFTNLSVLPLPEQPHNASKYSVTLVTAMQANTV
jgi:hypothetical protein